MADNEVAWVHAYALINSINTKFGLASSYAGYGEVFTQQEKLERFKSLTLPIYRYHNRWEELGDEDFRIIKNAPLDYSKGYFNLSIVAPSGITPEVMNGIAYEMQAEPFRKIKTFDHGEYAESVEDDAPIYDPRIVETELGYLKKIRFVRGERHSIATNQSSDHHES